MTTLKKERAVSAGKFVDEILSDILSAPENEILEDDDELTRASGLSADDFVRRAAAACQVTLGKARFEKAKAELQQSEKRGVMTVVTRDTAQVVREYVNSLKNAASRLSIAARGATQLSSHDQKTAIEDLTELKGRKRGPKK